MAPIKNNWRHLSFVIMTVKISINFTEYLKDWQ